MDLVKLWTLIILTCLTQLVVGQDSIQKKYSRGQLTEWPWKNGKINGVQKVYFQNGKLHIEAVFVDGLLNGYYKEYYPNGQLAKVRYYTDHKANGPDSSFTEKGVLKSILHFKDGSQNKALYFDTSGLIIKEMNVENGIAKMINKKYHDGVLIEEDYGTGGIINGCKIYDDGKAVKLPDTTFFAANKIKRIVNSDGRKYKMFNYTEQFVFYNDSNRYVSEVWIEKQIPAVRQLLYKNKEKIKEFHQVNGRLDWCKFYVNGKEDKVIEYDENGKIK